MKILKIVTGIVRGLRKALKVIKIVNIVIKTVEFAANEFETEFNIKVEDND